MAGRGGGGGKDLAGMSRLTGCTGTGEMLRATAHAEEIALELDTIGVRFERWPLHGHEERVAALRAAGYTTSDTVSVTPDHPERGPMRNKFLAEHRHAEDEVRFFLAGE